jgi:hypothetical protein
MMLNVKRWLRFIASSTKVGQLGSPESAEMRRLIWPGGRFEELLLLHDGAPSTERAILEQVIYSKAINYRRDVKRNRINPDDQARINVLLTAYHASAAPIPRKKNR